MQQVEEDGAKAQPKYTRNTELRHLGENDVYRLATILDENNCWKQLMEIIPKRLNAQASSAHGALNYATANGEMKYSNDDIRLIETAFRRMNTYQCVSQIMIDEWKTSGQRHERPTVGVLLQLLVHAELFRAADFVALELLNEPKPQRPMNGPAAAIDISLSEELCNNIDFEFDSDNYPDTETLNQNANCTHTIAFNKDFDQKYFPLNKNVTNLNQEETTTPTPPPRTRTTRQNQLLQQQQQQRTFATVATASTIEAQTQNAVNVETTQNIPKLSALMVNSTNSTPTTRTNQEYSLNMPHTELTNISEAPMPLVSILIESMKNSNSGTEAAKESLPVTGLSAAAVVAANADARIETNHITTEDNLPVISALNLHGERDKGNETPKSDVSNSSSSSSLSNDGDAGDESARPVSQLYENGIDVDVDDDDGVDDDDDDGDISLPNLSIFEQHSSNNDSSLTTVTGTSGDNSFEISNDLNDSSSASNDDNIPCLSGLNQ